MKYNKFTMPSGIDSSRPRFEETPLRDCAFLGDDRRYWHRLLRMLWFSVLLHLVVFSAGYWVAPYVRTGIEPEMPPLFREEAGRPAGVDRESIRPDDVSSFGPPPVIGEKTSRSKSPEERAGRTDGKLGVRETVITREWTVDERLAWLETIISEIVRFIYAFLDKLVCIIR